MRGDSLVSIVTSAGSFTLAINAGSDHGAAERLFAAIDHRAYDGGQVVPFEDGGGCAGLRLEPGSGTHGSSRLPLVITISDGVGLDNTNPRVFLGRVWHWREPTDIVESLRERNGTKQGFDEPVSIVRTEHHVWPGVHDDARQGG
jgi:hypothetical protein